MNFFVFAFLTTFAVLFSSATTRDLLRSKVEGRIIGGQAARAGEFPFSAAIYIHTNNGQYFCGGALISNEWILTAGQCVDGAIEFTIILGANNVKELDSTSTTLATEEYFINPNFDPNTLQHDIAVIKLRMPVGLTDYIQPIALPTEALNDHTVVVAIGWGQTSDEDAAAVADLYRVTITVLTNEECRLTYGSAIYDEMVCAEGNYNQGTCLGDTGSPLVQYRYGQQATAVAIASFYSGNGCESTDPSGFIRTFPYVDWIRNVTGIL